MGLPLGLDVDLAGSLALVRYVEPLVEAGADAKSGQFGGHVSDQVAGCVVFVPDGEGNIVTDVFDIDMHDLAGPLGNLTSALQDLGLVLLLSGGDRHVGVHFGEDLRVSGESCL